MAQTCGVVAHGAIFSKHMAAFTLACAEAGVDNRDEDVERVTPFGKSSAVVDVVLAAKDGWTSQLLADISSALCLADGQALLNAIEGVGQALAAGEVVEVDILASKTELLNDAGEQAACLHPTELRSRRRCSPGSTTGSAADDDSGGGGEWRVWRVPAPPPPPPDGIVGIDKPKLTTLTRAAAGHMRAGGSAAAAAGQHRRKKKQNIKRARAFAELLIGEFGRDALRAGTGVVDVAGGSGELAFELSTRWGIPCTIVDPRGEGVRIKACNRRLLAQRAANSAALSAPWTAMSPLARQLAEKWACFTPAAAAHLKRCFEAALMDDPAAATLLTRCSAIVGLHPDQATGAVVDAGLVLNKPWAVVPCCVFPSAYPERTRPGTDSERVRTTEHLVEHLAARAPGRIRVGEISCGGANAVLWCAAEEGGAVAAEGRLDFPWPSPRTASRGGGSASYGGSGAAEAQATGVTKEGSEKTGANEVVLVLE